MQINIRKIKRFFNVRGHRAQANIRKIKPIEIAAYWIIAILYIYVSSTIEAYSQKMKAITVFYTISVGLYYMISNIWYYTKKLSLLLRRKHVIEDSNSLLWLVAVILPFSLNKDSLSILTFLFITHITYSLSYLIYILLVIENIKKNKPCQLHFYTKEIHPYLTVGLYLYVVINYKSFTAPWPLLWLYVVLSWLLQVLFYYIKNGFLLDAFLYKSIFSKKSSLLYLLIINKKLARLKYLCVLSCVFLLSILICFIKFVYIFYLYL
jgi:hypothetical protein